MESWRESRRGSSARYSAHILSQPCTETISAWAGITGIALGAGMGAAILTKMRLTYFTYPELTLLPQDDRAYACWYFYTLAQQQKEKIGESIDDQFGILEGERWMSKQYVQLARSVALMYQLESPDEFAKFWKYVWLQAKALNLPEPATEYTKLCPGIVTN